MGADGDIDAVILMLELFKPDVLANGHAGVDLNAGGEDGLDLLVKELSREAVARDAVAEHAAELLALFVDGHGVAHQSQIVRAAQAARAAADDGDLLARRRSAGRIRHIARMVDGIALQPADVDGVIHHTAAAARLARMLTDIGAGRGERIVLADQADGVGAAPGADKRHIAGDIHACGTEVHARDGDLQPGETPVVTDVLDIVVAEALQPVDDEPRGIAPDGAVGCIDNGARRLFDDGERLHGGGAVHNLLDQQRELPQTDAAGDTFTAGLCVAQLQKGQRHIHGTQARGARGNPALDVAVEIIHHGLGAVLGFDVQSAQSISLLLPAAAETIPQGRADVTA